MGDGKSKQQHGIDPGVEKLVARFRQDPGDQRLLSRIVALIADIRVPERKQNTLLYLATEIADLLPREAMRYAHQVYQTDRHCLEALDLVVACLRALGRLAKAEILAIEIKKLRGLQRIPGPPNVDRQVIMTPKKQRPEVRSEFSIVAPLEPPREIEDGQHEPIPGFSDLDLKEFSKIAGVPNFLEQVDLPVQEERSLDSKPSDSADDDHSMPWLPVGGDWGQVQPSEPLPSKDEPEINPVPVDADQLPPSAKPTVQIPSQIPFPESPDPLRAKARKKAKIKQNDSTRISAFRSPPAGQASPPEFESQGSGVDVEDTDDLVAAAELFDYYWQQGFLKEARDLLNQTAAVCSNAPWWRARKNLMRSSRIGIEHVNKVTGAPVQHQQSPPPEREAQRPSLQQLNQQQHQMDTARLHHQVQAMRIRNLDSAKSPLPTTEPSQGGITAAMLRAQFGDEPGDACIAYMDLNGLKTSSPDVWSVYLDALCHLGRFLEAQQEVRRQIRSSLPLPNAKDWASVAWPRLQQIIAALRLTEVQWDEANGAEGLAKQLEHRLPPAIHGYLIN